eukprot:TRINITY_DN3238_c0_g1_i6.p1 TRINITY_DN3238_c0_g1~~TRINITY_DN3238_c0_g1_i6.p1  ORF type:complete len:148 (+),score=11.41 TRINITY_DN3238_c0_g1_i6:113-556(+)
MITHPKDETQFCCFQIDTKVLACSIVFWDMTTAILFLMIVAEAGTAAAVVIGLLFFIIFFMVCEGINKLENDGYLRCYVYLRAIVNILTILLGLWGAVESRTSRPSDCYDSCWSYDLEYAFLLFFLACGFIGVYITNVLWKLSLIHI